MSVHFRLEILGAQSRELFLHMAPDRIKKLFLVLFLVLLGGNADGRTIEAVLFVRCLGKSPDKTNKDFRIGLVVERLGDYNT